MLLTSKQRQQLKAQAHGLKPIVFIGNHGLTSAVQNEVTRALDDHELIKIGIQGKERAERQQILETICLSLKAELVQTVGSIGILYRKKEDH
jgi:RNA-binding protein